MNKTLNQYGMVVDLERPWLGGYIPGPYGDIGSYCPDVWEWALDRFKIESVIDVGAGAGIALNWFEMQGGCEVLGVDGLPPDRDYRIIEHDYTLGPYDPGGDFDLCWSCEFVEHVEEQFVPNFLATFSKAKYVMMTHGLIWQGGHHHVNCQRPEYWIEHLEDAGFRFLGRETVESRDRALQHYWKHSGLIFRRKRSK